MNRDGGRWIFYQYVHIQKDLRRGGIDVDEETSESIRSARIFQI